jgi:hypothetical protein
MKQYLQDEKHSIAYHLTVSENPLLESDVIRRLLAVRLPVPGKHQFDLTGPVSLPIVTTEDGVLPVGVGEPMEVIAPAFWSIANTDMSSDWELAANRYLPEGSTLSETGAPTVGTREPIADKAPVVESTANAQISPVFTFAT